MTPSTFAGSNRAVLLSGSFMADVKPITMNRNYNCSKDHTNAVSGLKSNFNNIC